MRMVSLSAAALKKKRCIRRCSMKARGASKVKACSSIFNRVLRYDLTPLRENIVYFSSISKTFSTAQKKKGCLRRHPLESAKANATPAATAQTRRLRRITPPAAAPYSPHLPPSSAILLGSDRQWCSLVLPLDLGGSETKLLRARDTRGH